MSGYRDDSETLRARLDDLRGQLAAADERIAQLEGKTALPAEVRATLVPNRLLLGAPSAIRLQREVPFEISSAGHEAISRLLRARLGIEVSHVGPTLAAPGAFLMTARDGRTSIDLQGDWSDQHKLTIGRFAISGIAALACIAMILVTRSHAPFAPPSIAAASVAIVLGLRARATWRGRRQRETYEGVFAAVIAIAHAHSVRHETVRVVGVRVDSGEEYDNSAPSDAQLVAPPARHRRKG